MSQANLSKSQLAILDALIADAQEKGKDTLGGASSLCFIDCVLDITVTVAKTVAVTIGGNSLGTDAISIEKLIEYRKSY
jgi:hypothetical protein